MEKPTVTKLCADIAVYGALFLTGAYFLLQGLWLTWKSGVFETADGFEIFMLLVGIGVVIWATAVMYFETKMAITGLSALRKKRAVA